MAAWLKWWLLWKNKTNVCKAFKSKLVIIYLYQTSPKLETYEDAWSLIGCDVPWSWVLVLFFSGVQRSEGAEEPDGAAHLSQTERCEKSRSHHLPPRRRSGRRGEPCRTDGQTWILRRVRETTEYFNPSQHRRRDKLRPMI